MADNGRAQTTGITGCDPACEKHPNMSTLPGTRNLQSGWDAKCFARMHEGASVVLPLGFIEIDGEKGARVIFQQGIDADRMLTEQMTVDDRTRQRRQPPVTTIPAFGARLVTHSGAPLIGAGRCVSRLTRTLVLPADGVDIRSPTK